MSIGPSPRRRVVAIEADLGADAEERWRYGSGLLIGDRQVLTAAHVVAGARAISVHRLEEEREWQADVSSTLVGDLHGFDLAIVTVADAEALEGVEVALVNRDAPGDKLIDDCWSVGFPSFQSFRAPDGTLQRETARVGGTISPLSGLRARMLSLEVTATPRALPPGGAPLDAHSEWEGMSGAGVFAGQLLVGVVTEHVTERGESSISVTPFDQLLDDDGVPADIGEWRRRLALGDVAALPRLPASPTEPPPPPPLAEIAPGDWVVDVHTPMGSPTMRIHLERTQQWGGGLIAAGVSPRPDWRAQGQWQALPGQPVVDVQGMQFLPGNIPPQSPLTERFTFASVERNMLRGVNAAGAPTTWRRA